MSRSRLHQGHGDPPSKRAPVVVGVVPQQSADLVRRAASLARDMGAGLLCVWVDGSRALVGQDDDGTLLTTPVDPDQDDDSAVLAEDRLLRHLEDVLAESSVSWRFVYTVGEVARGLSGVADQNDAALIVVGTRRPGLAGWMNQLVGGSVAGRLAHTQHRPVTVIPPATRDSA